MRIVSAAASGPIFQVPFHSFSALSSSPQPFLLYFPPCCASLTSPFSQATDIVLYSPLKIHSFLAYSSFKVSLTSSFGPSPSLFFRLGRRPVSSLRVSPLRVYLQRSSDQQFHTQRIAIMSSSEDDTPLVRANGRSAGESLHRGVTS